MADTRRKLLTGILAGSVSGVTGCLRMTESGSSQSETSVTDSGTTKTSETDTTEPTENTTTEPDIREEWKLKKWGSDIITYDETFYASTWVSREIYSLTPEGEQIWKTDKIGKFKRDSMAVDESTLVACGYDGYVVLLDRETGDVIWEFANAEYAKWGAQPLITDNLVITVNEAEKEQNVYIVYVFDKQTGEINRSIQYSNLESWVHSVGMVDDLLFLSTANYIDVYDATSMTKVGSFSDGLFGQTYAHDGNIFSVFDDNVYRYDIGKSNLSRVWGASFRGNVFDLMFVPGGIVANGEAGLFKLNWEGEEQWWVQTDAAAGRSTKAGNKLVVMDEYLQLYSIDLSTGEKRGKIRLSSEGSIAPVASIGTTVLAAINPIKAFSIS